MPTHIRWNAIKESLRQDLLKGAFEDHERLPKIGQLQKLYAVSQPTLRKAIQALTAEGALVIDKRKYRIARIKRAAQFTTVLLISPGDSIDKVRIYSGKFDDFYQALEARCARSNIRLKCCGLSIQNQDEVIAYLQKGRDFFGYCVYGSGIPPDLLDKILRLLAGRGQPIAIIDEGNTLKLGRLKNPCTLFSSAGFLAGFQVGQFLQELGHRRIAYVSVSHETEWSQTRYAGLLHSFPEADRHDCVKLMAFKQPEVSIVNDDPRIIKTIEKITGFSGQSPWRTSVPSLEFYETINRMVRSFYDLGDLAKLMPKHMPELLTDTSISAIVGSNDYMAVLTHEFLKQKGIAVPGDISVCGFDNADMAMNDDLTSYNFLFGNIAADVLAYIINPSAPAFKGRREIECSGAIIQRSTTGQARRAE